MESRGIVLYVLSPSGDIQCYQTFLLCFCSVVTLIWVIPFRFEQLDSSASTLAFTPNQDAFRTSRSYF